MKLALLFAWLASGTLAVHAAEVPTYCITPDHPDRAAWQKIFASVNIAANCETNSRIVVLSPGSRDKLDSLSADRLVVVQGAVFPVKGSAIPVQHEVDEHAPFLPILWSQPADLTPVDLPSDFHVYATERWTGAPLLAGKRTEHGAVLWLATGPGVSGYERYPYLLQAFAELGLTLPVQGTTLAAFFDSPYRIRADVDYLARRWRASGIAVLYVAAWHNMEDDPGQDAYLQRLIEACHRHAILVYAWLELPHVSETFWADHPAWREKTALGQDAQLDWRKLMNLQNTACREAVAKSVARLLERFDWDGVNLAELYFESLEGAANPARFTPMNADVRSEFQALSGVDPATFFAAGERKNKATLAEFLRFRAVLAARLQSDWLTEVDKARVAKPYLDVILTHIDDRFDGEIRNELGADVAHSLPLLARHRSTLLVEDPANLWDLGPDRYARLAAKYAELSPLPPDLAVDINIVERYQDVYPTKKQTGLELFELVHQAAASFGHVALYFENSLDQQDLPLLPAAATTAQLTQDGWLTAPASTRVLWKGPATLDGRPWPLRNELWVLVPAGRHRLNASTEMPPITLTDFNGEVRSAVASADAVEVSYVSRSRAIAALGSSVAAIQVDGAAFWNAAGHPGETAVVLPAGQHLVTFHR